MDETATTYTGPLGSTIHVLRADADTIAELAAIDWSRHFSRVCLDPVRGLITLMSPSFSHDDLASVLDVVVDETGSILLGATRGIRSTRLRGQDEPPGTGLEPDCAFYLGARALALRAAILESKAAATACGERTAPDLVVEVEITHADEGKAERYRDIGVRELWRLHGRKGPAELRVEFLSLDPERAPRMLDRSVVLEGLTPDDVCEAVEGVRFGETDDARRQVVARIVRRRQGMSRRVREDREAYSA